MKKLVMFVVAGLVCLSFSSYAGGMTPEQIAALNHANPMPNLMSVVSENQEKLGLTEEQKGALAEWVDYSMPRVMQMVQAVGKLEKELHDAAVAGAPGSVLQKIAMQSLTIRGAIMKQKLACRNNLAQILSEEQLRQTIELYQKSRS